MSEDETDGLMDDADTEESPLVWMDPILTDTLEAFLRVQRVRNLCFKAIDLLTAMPDAAERAAAVLPWTVPPDPDSAIVLAREMVAAAWDEMNRRYSLLMQESVVMMWSHLENFVKTILCEWWHHDAGLRARFQAKGTLPHQPDDAWRTLWRWFNPKDDSAEGGVNRFEHVFQQLGLDPHPRNEMYEALVEFAEMRHCIAHRGGRADAKLLTQCPSLRLKKGEEITLWPDDIARATDAVQGYITFLTLRILRFRNEPGADAWFQHFDAQYGASAKKVQEVQEMLEQQRGGTGDNA